MPANLKPICNAMIPTLKHINATQTHYLSFLEKLRQRGFTGDISPDYANRTVMATDNSVYQVLPQGVVFPRDVDDLVVLCELADSKPFTDIVLSPRGGGTGTNGQSLTDGIVVDTSKYMNKILEINAEEGWARVQCGVVKDQLNGALRPHGFFFAPELSTSNRATIGGMINTDASGQGSCLYGKTRDHVLELKTVLLDGSVLTSKPLEENELEALFEQQDRTGLIHRLVNSIEKEHGELIAQKFPKLNRCLTGYDLAHIRDDQGRLNLNNVLCGSEGTLGFIAEAKINILPIPKHAALVLVKYNDFDSSLRDAETLMQANPTSIETIDSKVLQLAMNDFIWHQVEEFFDELDRDHVSGINLVEYTADSEESLKQGLDGFTQQLEKTSKESSNGRLGYSIAMGESAVKKIWAMRKRAVGLLGNAKGEARPVAFVEDTAVPPEHLADFIKEFREILDSYNLDYGMFGHVDAGVLHVRPALDMKNPEHEKMAWEISDRVADLTQQYHGLLWGEHGKGVRSEYAPKFFGELYPQLQRIKSAFDPRNQLNPGKIATPDDQTNLLAIDEVVTRGQLDREIPVKLWEEFSDAVYCNGNGACFDWDPDNAMCPSWKATRERIHSPKGRASLMREWLNLVGKSTDKPLKISRNNSWKNLNQFPERLRSWRAKRKGEYDFSHQVYDSMAGCLACKSCAGACPIKVNVPEFRSQFLELYHTRYFRPLKDYLVSSLEVLLPYCATLPRLYNAIMSLPPVKWILHRGVGFVDGPMLSTVNLKDCAIADNETLQSLSQEQKSITVVIVQDAFTSYFETPLVRDVIDLCKRLGLNPLVAPYKPNGKPLHVHGFLNRFANTAERNASSLNAIARHGVSLVGIDPSMTLTYQSEYKKYLKKEKPPQVHLIQDWLLENIELLDIPETERGFFKMLPHCTESTNASGSLKNWEKLFSAFGQDLDIKSVGCCGMAGTYGHEARNQATSKHIFTLSWQPAIEREGNCDALVATGFSCRSQIKREMQQRVPHPLQALLTAMR